MNETDQVLRTCLARKPLTWRALFKRSPLPTAAERAQVALEECRCAQLEHSQLREYHVAMVDMLNKREARLQADIARLRVDTQPG